MTSEDPESKNQLKLLETPDSSLSQVPCSSYPSSQKSPFSVIPSAKSISKIEKSYLKKQKREKLLETVKASLKSKGKESLIHELLEDEKKMKGIRKYFDTTGLCKKMEYEGSSSEPKQFQTDLYMRSGSVDRNLFQCSYRKNGNFGNFKENSSENLDLSELEAPNFNDLTKDHCGTKNIQNLKKYSNNGFIQNQEHIIARTVRPDYNPYGKFRSLSTPQGSQHPSYQYTSHYRNPYGYFPSMNHYQRPHAGYPNHYSIALNEGQTVPHSQTPQVPPTPSATVVHPSYTNHPVHSTQSVPSDSHLPQQVPQFRFPYNPYKRFQHSWYAPNNYYKYQGQRIMKDQKLQECLEGYFNHCDSGDPDNICESGRSSFESLSSVNYEYGIPSVPEMKEESQNIRKNQKKSTEDNILVKKVDSKHSSADFEKDHRDNLLKNDSNQSEKGQTYHQSLSTVKIESQTKEIQCDLLRSSTICESCQTNDLKTSESSQSSEKHSKVSSQFSFTLEHSSDLIANPSETANLDQRLRAKSEIESLLPAKRPCRDFLQESSVKYSKRGDAETKNYEGYFKSQNHDSHATSEVVKPFSKVSKESKVEMISKIIERTTLDSTFPLKL